MGVSMRIYLIRHGETDWNIDRRYQGIEDIPLNNTGVMQAKLCAKALSNMQFDAIYSSPLTRAYDTAALIAQGLRECHVMNDIIGEDIPSVCYEVKVDERLLERDFGLISGLYPKDREAFINSKKEANMEPFEHLTTRVMQNLEEIRSKYPDGNVLVITHGGVINAILHVLSKGEIGTGKTLVANTCITILNDQTGELEIESYNQKLSKYS